MHLADSLVDTLEFDTHVRKFNSGRVRSGTASDLFTYAGKVLRAACRDSFTRESLAIFVFTVFSSMSHLVFRISIFLDESSRLSGSLTSFCLIRSIVCVMSLSARLSSCPRFLAAFASRTLECGAVLCSMLARVLSSETFCGYSVDSFIDN
jgi:hypothetical protein